MRDFAAVLNFRLMRAARVWAGERVRLDELIGVGPA